MRTPSRWDRRYREAQFGLGRRPGRRAASVSTALTVAVVILLVVAACGQPAQSTARASPAASPALTPLQQALRGIRDDGTWSKDTALAAFAAAFGPLPGVEAPPADRSYHSGTAALQMVEAYWSELADAQRQAVRDYVGPAAATIVPAVYQVGLLDTYQQLADQAAADIGSHLGHPLGGPVKMVYPANENGTAWAWADGNWNEVPPGSHATGCVVSIPPSTVKDPSRTPYLRWLLLHEVWHCFEAALVDFQGAVSMPKWISEGEADWVAEAVTGGAGQPPPMVGYWHDYVWDPGRPLYARSYDAVGFYAQLAHDNIDPWTVIEKIYAAGASGSDGAFQASGATASTFADRWGASWFRDGQPSSDWAMSDGYGIPLPVQDRAPPESITLADGDQGSLSAKPNAGGIADVHTTAFITHFDVSGVGRVGETAGGGLDVVVRAGTLDLCTDPSGNCACPPGSDNTQTPPRLAPQNLRASVTGEQHNLSLMSLRGISKDEWCRTRPSSRPSGGSPCGPGCGGSNGDPHLRTIDGARYDLMAAGEYVLLRSADGSIDIQGRQELPDCGGLCQATINTALAVRVNGHRVGFHAASGVPDVRVDGTLVGALAVGAVDLGSGATLTPYKRGYELDLPDGTKVWALSVGSFGINVLVLPSDALRASGVGLIARVPGAAQFRVPALPDGATLPAPKDRHDRYHLLYEVLAPAWRVTAATSLFDYDAGKTTDSFTVTGFPTESVPQTTDDLDPTAVANARTTCASVADPDLADQCAYDVATTGSTQYVSLYAVTDQLQAGGTATLDEPVPGTTPPPSGGLASGIALVADHITNGVIATPGPDGTLYVEVGEQAQVFGDVTTTLLAVDGATGKVRQRATAVAGGVLAYGAGSLWAGQFKRGDVGCDITRLDPVTLAVQADVPTVCGGMGYTAFVPLGDAIWFIDRTGADVGGHGAHLRRIDPASNTIDTSPSGSVELPFITDYLGSTGAAALATSSIFTETSAGLILGDHQHGLYRLRTGSSQFEPLGKPGAGLGWSPSGDGVWTQTEIGTYDAPTGTAAFFSGGSAPDMQLGIDGNLVAADDQAVYSSYSESDDEADGLWRYPLDQGAPQRIATSGFVPNGFGGQQRLLYRDISAPLLVGDHVLVKLWLVVSPTENTQSALMIQSVPVP